MSTNIEQRVKHVIAEQLSHHVDAVRNDATLESLGADSLDQIEIVMYLEEEFGIDIDDGEAEKVKTVQQAIDCVTRTALPA